MAQRMITALATLHGVDFEGCGLGDLGRPDGISSARCGASPACGSEGDARPARARRGHRLAAGAPPGERRAVARPRRLPHRQPAVLQRAAGAAAGDRRLGDGDAGRPARRRRLPVRPPRRARRPGHGHDRAPAGHARGRLPGQLGVWPCDTPSSRAARSRTSAGTACWRCGSRRSSSSRATPGTSPATSGSVVRRDGGRCAGAGGAGEAGGGAQRSAASPAKVNRWH